MAAYNTLFKVIRSYRPGRESEAIRATWVNVGFSFPGLEKFGTVSTPTDVTVPPAFPSAFTEGMGPRHTIIGDVATEQATWVVGGSARSAPRTPSW